MGFHHVAIATRDLETSHRFYTDAMGFRLVKVQVAPTGSASGGWAKHLFYDTGDSGMLALWDLHDDDIPEAFDPAISTGLGLPEWVNHLAFDAPTLDALTAHCRRWQQYGIDVVELDHGWCRSIYATDPNGILVEFCCTLEPCTTADADDARRLLADPAPPLGELPGVTIHPALVADQER